MIMLNFGGRDSVFAALGLGFAFFWVGPPALAQRYDNPSAGYAKAQKAALSLEKGGAPQESTTAVPPPPENDPIARAAFKVLDKHCARCHQAGKLARKKPAKGLGNILDLAAISRNPKLIVPGDANASAIFALMKKREMPYDVFQEFSGGPEPAAFELAAIRDWIDDLGQTNRTACYNRRVIDSAALRDFVANDIERSGGGRNDFRYATLAHLYSSCDSGKAMEVYRQGVIKLLNSLSRKARLLVLPDAANTRANALAYTVLKFRLSDLGWSRGDWNKLVKDYPYKLEPDLKRFETFKRRNGTAIPMVRGDWLAFTASRPPHYHNLLNLPTKLGKLHNDLNVNVSDNLRRFKAARAGFQKSLVSRNNRVIERHPRKNGVFWTSYDFAGNIGRQNIFEHPLGPNISLPARIDGGGKNAFKHDGGESIFTLKNGFNGYFLSNAKGERIDKAPTAIVQDQSQKDFAVTNGISCMGCHAQGFRKASDDIRAHVLGDTTFDNGVRDTVTKLYAKQGELNGLIERDRQRFTRALRRAGLDPDLTLDGVEVINALSKRYERDVSLELAASEFGLRQWEFLARTRGNNVTIARLNRLLEKGTVPRDQFEAQFKDMMKEIFSSDAGKRAAEEIDKLRGIAALQPQRALRIARPRPTNTMTRAVLKYASSPAIETAPIAPPAATPAPGWDEAEAAIARAATARSSAPELTIGALITARDAPPPAEPESGGFAIQIGAYDSVRLAEDVLARVRQSTGDLLQGTKPLTIRLDQRGRAIYLARFVGYKDRSLAERTCDVIQQRNLECEFFWDSSQPN